VAGGAIARDARRQVVGIGGLREIRQMATHTIARNAQKMVAYMASGASQI
jgi:hypothetical protein